MSNRNLVGKRVLAYARVSTDEQRKTGYSLQSQENQLKEFIERNGMILIDFFQESHSAKTNNRPQFNKLIEYAKKNPKEVDYILVIKWDRLSRNTVETLPLLKFLQKLGIGVNAINEWFDEDKPSDKFMRILSLGMAELDNENRAEKVKDGNYRAYCEGRHINKPPFGYISGKDSLGKTLMKPHPENAEKVKAILEDYATGHFSQNEIIKKYNALGIKLSKSNLSRMLANHLYAGLITVKAYKGEPERVIKALHEPLISETTFKRIQHFLNEKNRLKEKPVYDNNDLPLRGKILKCPNCNRNLTGYTKTKPNGLKFHYYNCDNRLGCGFTCNATKANRLFEKSLSEIKPSEPVLKLFEVLLIKKYESMHQTRENEVKVLQKRCIEIEEKKDFLVEKLISGTLNDEVYKKHERIFNAELDSIKMRISEMPMKDESLQKYLAFSLNFISKLDSTYSKADIKVKKMILGSILSGNPVFDGEKYRTLEFKESIALLSKQSKAFKKLDTKKGGSFSETSRLVLEAGLEPARAKRPQDFKSGVSTDSTTRAFGILNNKI